MPSQAENPQFRGLAEVYRQASRYPDVFIGFEARHVKDVSDLPVGLTVYCLPMLESDAGWRAVVFNVSQGPESEPKAKLAWVHPQCLRVLPIPSRQPQIELHRTSIRGKKGPTIDVGPIQKGNRLWRGMLLLDARWDYALRRVHHECSGHCFELCNTLVSDESAFGYVLDFAIRVNDYTQARICCERGKHRSVSVANVLQLCFGQDAKHS